MSAGESRSTHDLDGWPRLCPSYFIPHAVEGGGVAHAFACFLFPSRGRGCPSTSLEAQKEKGRAARPPREG